MSSFLETELLRAQRREAIYGPFSHGIYGGAHIPGDLQGNFSAEEIYAKIKSEVGHKKDKQKIHWMLVVSRVWVRKILLLTNWLMIQLVR